MKDYFERECATGQNEANFGSQCGCDGYSPENQNLVAGGYDASYSCYPHPIDTRAYQSGFRNGYCVGYRIGYRKGKCERNCRF